MWNQIVLFALILSLLYLLYPKGITAILIGITAINALWIFVWTWLAHREIGYSVTKLAVDLLPFMGIALASIAVAWLVTKGINHQLLLMIAKILVTAAIYFFLMWISRSVIFRECVNILLKRDNIKTT